MCNYKKSRNYLFLFADLLILSVSFISAVFITKNRLILMDEISFKTDPVEIILLILFLLIWVIFSNVLELYDRFKTSHRLIEFFTLIKCVFMQLIIATILLFFLKSILFSRFFMFLYISILTIGLIISRTILKISLKLSKGNGKFTRKILIIGDNSSGTEFYKMINARSDSGFKILGIISDYKPEDDYKNYLGTTKNLEEILDKYEVDDIVISLGDLEYKEIGSILLRCESYPVRVRIIPEYSKFLSKRFHIDTFVNIPIILIEDDPLDNLQWRFLKRFSDILIAIFFFLFIFIWFCPLIAIAIKLSSKGPVFFKQERWGRKNKKIIVYKFRTMKVDSTDTDKDGNYNQAKKNDSRITALGSFLRKTNLDEIPQILNVIIGNMSIVGPRPHPTPLNVESKGSVKRYLKRHLVKPGITGWAQINGLRGETHLEGLMEKRVEHDIWYIENWNLWMDLQIILLTVWNMLKGEPNAY